MKNFELISHIPTSKQHSDLTHYSENPLFEQDKKVIPRTTKVSFTLVVKKTSSASSYLHYCLQCGQKQTHTKLIVYM